VPKGLEAKYVKVMRPYFRLAEEASATGDDAGLLAALVNINSVPLKLLAVPRGGRDARNRRRNINIVRRNLDEHIQLQAASRGGLGANTPKGPDDGSSLETSESHNLTVADKLLSPSIRRAIARSAADIHLVRSEQYTILNWSTSPRHFKHKRI
jgi:hypothetical protein